MGLIAKHRARHLLPEMQRRAALFDNPPSHDAQIAQQLAAFNATWARVRTTVPYYQDLAQSRRLPEAFRAWPEVIEKLPVLNRPVIQEHGPRLASTERPAEWWRMTGGSTAEPIQIPAWHSENADQSPNGWLARSWFGIQPNDRCFAIWGHSHLLGTGLKGQINRRIREWKDWALGYYRFSAYKLDDASLRQAGDLLLRFRPQYVFGYSVALDRFARVNAARAADFARLGLKVAIGAAEGFPAPDSRELLGRVLGCPVAMEYGSVEASWLAHSTPAGDHQAFWNSYFIEALDRGASGGRIVRITSLTPRCFPLIRYEIGDELDLGGHEGVGVSRFARVLGRCNDYLMLADGSRVHSELITHCVRSCPEVLGYQAVQDGHDVRIHVTTKHPLADETIAAIQVRLQKLHASLRNVPIERVAALHRTIAGKTPIVVKTNQPRPAYRASA